MGHSKRTQTIVASSGFRVANESSQETINNYLSVVKSRKSSLIVNYGMKYIITALPNGAAKLPLYYSVKYGVQFLHDCYKHDVNYAMRNMVKTALKTHIMPHVIDSIWECVDDRLIESGVDKSMSSFAENSFRQTMSDIFNNGGNAL